MLFGVQSLRRAALVLWGLQVAAEGLNVVRGQRDPAGQAVIQPPTFPLLSNFHFGDHTLAQEEVLVHGSDFRRGSVTRRG